MILRSDKFKGIKEKLEKWFRERAVHLYRGCFYIGHLYRITTEEDTLEVDDLKTNRTLFIKVDFDSFCYHFTKFTNRSVTVEKFKNEKLIYSIRINSAHATAWRRGEYHCKGDFLYINRHFVRVNLNYEKTFAISYRLK